MPFTWPWEKYSWDIDHGSINHTNQANDGFMLNENSPESKIPSNNELQ